MSDAETFADPDALAEGVAQWLLMLARAKDGAFALCLSGGATPELLYRRLTMLEGFPWARTHLFWGDERFVPPTDAQSNYRMVREALLGAVPIPPANIHAMPTEGLDPDGAATAYEATLRGFYGAAQLDPARPLFDAMLLGLGEDGHTASLFPGSPVLRERERWVAAVVGAKPEPRLTLTYPALDSSRHAAFLVTGAGKRDILARARAGEAALPAAQLRPVGQLHWFADRAAAG